MTYRDLGILVLGHSRAKHLGLVLDSLELQNVLSITHVWLDGGAGRMEWKGKLDDCRRVAALYAVAETRAHYGHLGIEKLMLNGLEAMARRYQKIVVLEDDCFPTRRAIEIFDRALDAIADRPDVYSIYGHPFLVPAESDTITRFQGWGWATTSDKLKPVLERLYDCFRMNEQDYLTWVQEQLSDDIRGRLDVTGRRKVLGPLSRHFTWDSCTALLTAMAGLVHMKTPVRTIYNCGMGPDSGHFPESEKLRHPPVNMISTDEVWNYFDQ